VSAEAQRLLAAISKYYSTASEPLNMSRAAELAGITSKRRLLELIGELEDAGMIRTRQMAERGRPHVIEFANQSIT
jgi:hypothetical protein